MDNRGRVLQVTDHMEPFSAFILFILVLIGLLIRGLILVLILGLVITTIILFFYFINILFSLFLLKLVIRNGDNSLNECSTL